MVLEDGRRDTRLQRCVALLLLRALSAVTVRRVPFNFDQLLKSGVAGSSLSWAFWLGVVGARVRDARGQLLLFGGSVLGAPEEFAWGHLHEGTALVLSDFKSLFEVVPAAARSRLAHEKGRLRPVCLFALRPIRIRMR